MMMLLDASCCVSKNFLPIRRDSAPQHAHDEFLMHMSRGDQK
jgi:hypothetical protein